METEQKTLSTSQRLQAAKERREKQQKERDAQRTEMASKFEETEKRRQEIASKRDADIETKKGHAQSRHEEAQRRREVQMRVRREKVLNDVEKSDRLSREAKKRNRHSWGGNINELNKYPSCHMIVRQAGGEELPDRPRPTALSKPMQNWISGLRSYDGGDGDGNESLNGSQVQSPRDRSFQVPERLLTPTAAFKAKRHTPEGASGDDSPVERSDSRMKRRTVSSLDINRLAQPKPSRSVSKDRGITPTYDAGGVLGRARSVTNLSPSQNRTTPRSRSRQTSRDDTISPRPQPEGRERRTISRDSAPISTPPSKINTTTRRSTPSITPKIKVEKPKSITPTTKTNPTKPKTPKPVAAMTKNTPKSTNKTSAMNKDTTPLSKQKNQNVKENGTSKPKPAAPPVPSLKDQINLEDLEDEPEVNHLRIDEHAPIIQPKTKNTKPDKEALLQEQETAKISQNTEILQPEVLEPLVITSKVNEHKTIEQGIIQKDITEPIVEMPIQTKVNEMEVIKPEESEIKNEVVSVSVEKNQPDQLEINMEVKNQKADQPIVLVETRVGTEYLITPATKEFPADDRRAADQSAGEIRQGSSEVVYESLAPVKTVAGIFCQSATMDSLKNDSQTSLATSSMTSITSTETDKDTLNDSTERKSVTWGENIQHPEITAEPEVPTEIKGSEEGEKKEKAKKKNKKKKNKEKEGVEGEKKKKKKSNSSKHSMISNWLQDNDDINTSDASPSGEPVAAVPNNTNNGAPTSDITNDDTNVDDYKKRLEEKKLEHQRRQQEQREAALKAERDEEERLEKIKANKMADMDKKLEDEKRKLDESIRANLEKAEQEKDQKRREDEEARNARKARIAAIMKRTRDANNEENSVPSENPNSEAQLVRTTSNENGNAESNISARVGSLLGSLRNSQGLNLHRNGTNNQSSQDTVNQAVPSVQ